MTRVDRVDVASDVIAFLATVTMAFAMDWSVREVVWALCLSGAVAGVLGVILPIWILLFFPSLEEKLFPDEKRVHFSFVGRILAAIFIALILSGPFFGFMLAFMAHFAERIPLADLETNKAVVLHALGVVWPACVITSLNQVFESGRRIFRGDGSAVLRPYGLIVKMVVILVLSNFGFGRWLIVPLVAAMFITDDAVMVWGERVGSLGRAAETAEAEES